MSKVLQLKRGRVESKLRFVGSTQSALSHLLGKNSVTGIVLRVGGGKVKKTKLLPFGEADL